MLPALRVAYVTRGRHPEQFSVGCTRRRSGMPGAPRVLFWLAVLLASVSGNYGKQNHTLKPRVVIPENYVKEVRPPRPKGFPVLVEFNMYIVDINSINVEDMDFRVDLFIRQSWVDPRLHMPDDIFEEGEDHMTLPPSFFDNLWQPDPHILNSKLSEIAKLTHKYSSVTLYKNKTVKYTARMYAIIACQMEFQLYPMDIQKCPLAIESFSYNRHKLKFYWGSEGMILNPELRLLQYHLGQPQLEQGFTYVQEKEGNFSRLVAIFRFERHIGHHLIQTFAPSALVVCLSWFSFWIGLDAIPGRVTLLVTSMLTLVTMFTGLKTDIPPVAYVKAMDLWMAGCMVFVFAALGEFVVVKVLLVRHELAKAHKMPPPRIPKIIPLRIQPSDRKLYLGGWKDLTVKASSSSSSTTTTTTTMSTNPTGTQGTTTRRRSSLARLRDRRLIRLSWVDRKTGIERILWHEIDRKSRSIFPILFLLFLITYWPILLYKASRV